MNIINWGEYMKAKEAHKQLHGKIINGKMFVNINGEWVKDKPFEFELKYKNKSKENPDKTKAWMHN
jgi:hypothetical protein